MIAERDGRKLKFLNSTELHNAVIDIISEIKMITGVLVYADAKEMMAQVSVIKRFLYSYGHLTKEEIIHAFYLNMQGEYEQVYRHYNKELNAEFMGDVMRAYLKYKLYVKEVKGPTIMRILQLGPKQEIKRVVNYQFWKEHIQEEYEMYRMNVASPQLWCTRKYYTLRKFGLLPFTKGFKTWLFFFRKVIAGNTEGTKLPAGADISSYQFSSYAEARAIFHSDADWGRCIDYLRRYAYWYVLKACAECGINDLFNEIAEK